MPYYRIFTLDSENHVAGPARVIEGNDDQEAIQQALAAVDGHDVELWKSDRLVARFPRVVEP